MHRSGLCQSWAISLHSSPSLTKLKDFDRPPTLFTHTFVYLAYLATFARCLSPVTTWTRRIHPAMTKRSALSEHPMIISPPSPRLANPSHTPVEHAPGLSPSPGTSAPRRYPSPSSTQTNPFEDRRTPSPATGSRRGKRAGGDDVDRLGYEDVSGSFHAWNSVMGG
jgi:hypothetical protein